MLVFATYSLFLAFSSLLSSLLFLVNHMDSSISRCDRASEEGPKNHALTASVPSLLSGPPAPPQDVTVQAGATATTVQVSWKPPALTPTGLSNGANVTGYGVYAKGQRVSMGCEPLYPAGAGLGREEGDKFSGENLRIFQLQDSTSLHKTQVGPSLWDLPATSLRVRKSRSLLLPSWVQCPLCPHHCPAPPKTDTSDFTSIRIPGGNWLASFNRLCVSKLRHM